MSRDREPEERGPEATGAAALEDARDTGDDAVIGRAFRGSIAVIVAVGAVALVVWLVTRGGGEGESVVEKEIVAPAKLSTEDPRAPDLPFVDVAATRGIDFVHESGARGEKLLPEAMGSGVAVFDADGDSDADLLFANGTPWPWDRGDAPAATPRLYLNEGDGTFRDATAGSGLDVAMYGTGVAIGDLDGDGLTDVYLTALGANRLFRNAGGGRFRDVTGASGTAGDDDAWSTSAGFFDADGDGDLDLFVCNYVRWSRELDYEVDFSLNGVDRAYGPPTNFAGSQPYFFRNEGDGTFVEVAESAGLHVANPATGEPLAKALALVPVDVDGDRDLDLFVANDTTQNFLFRNHGDGTFEEIGAVAGVGFDAAGNATGAMGADAARFRTEGGLALAIGNFANEMTSLYVSQGDPWLFADESALEGVGSPSRLALTFGLFFFDADLDGNLDLLQTNGHLEEEIAEVQASQSYRQPAQLFWNAGPDARAAFVPIDAGASRDLAREIVGRGAAFGDLDGDGDLDVVLTQVGGPPSVLRNDRATGHGSLRVRLVGPPSNRTAIGARVALLRGDSDVPTDERVVMPTRSYLSQVEPVLTYGLGEADDVRALRVIWPDGTERTVELEATDGRFHEMVVEY